MNRYFVAIVTAATLTGCCALWKDSCQIRENPDAVASAVPPASLPASPPGTADATDPAVSPPSSVGLFPVAMSDTAEPVIYTPASGDPGEDAVIARYWEGAPPVIPHTLEDMLPITTKENQCIDCHAVDEKLPGEPTPIPESHYVDFRNAPDQVRDSVAGSRQVCVSCHVLATDAKPLVLNLFE